MWWCLLCQGGGERWFYRIGITRWNRVDNKCFDNITSSSIYQMSDHIEQKWWGESRFHRTGISRWDRSDSKQLDNFTSSRISQMSDHIEQKLTITSRFFHTICANFTRFWWHKTAQLSQSRMIAINATILPDTRGSRGVCRAVVGWEDGWPEPGWWRQHWAARRAESCT